MLIFSLCKESVILGIKPQFMPLQKTPEKPETVVQKQFLPNSVF